MEKFIEIENSLIPLIGLGTWDLRGRQCIEVVASALEMGYRHIDTARKYGNEQEVGSGVIQSGIAREEIFITTKLSPDELDPGEIATATEKSLSALKTGYIDLLLIHWPTSDMDIEASLSEMFRLKEQGKVKHVGVSNFSPMLFRKAISLGPVVCNQVEFSPYVKQDENLEIAQESGLMITAYTPLGQGRIARDSRIKAAGEKYNRTPAQVALRWLIQQGNVSVIPKSSGEKHLRENMNIFDFELSEEDMKKIGR
jgi:2,5-diketo-D-gluconate reductase B